MSFSGGAIGVVNVHGFPVSACSFTSNMAEVEGGAISVTLSEVYISYSEFIMNGASAGTAVPLV